MSIKKNRNLMVEQIKRLRHELKESVNESKLNENKDKDLRKAVDLLRDVSDLIKKARRHDLDDDADEFYIRANQELHKLIVTIQYINQ